MRPIALIPIYLLSSSFVLITNYWFADPKHPAHFEGQYRKAAPMKFTTPSVKGSHLHYSDATSSFYYTHALNENNLLIPQVGYYHLEVDWKENPRFTGDNYDYAIGSIGWVSTSIEKWRWALAATFSLSTSNPDPIDTGVGYALVWGRYEFKPHTYAHIGFYGFTGVKNVYFVPIIGMEFFLTDQFLISAVFPFDIAARFFLSKDWYLSLAAEAFGSPYRFPQRIQGGKDGYKDGIFEIYSTVLDLSINFIQDHRFSFSLSGGYSLGGWMQIMNSHNSRGKYYKFDGAPYAQASLTFSL